MKVPAPRKLKSGNWFIQLRLGGQSVPVTAPTATECRRQAALKKAEHLAKTRVGPMGITLRQACERYIASRERARRSPETIRGYDVILRNRFQSVMDKPVASIDWQAAYDKEAERLAPKTVNSAWAFVRSACKASGVPLDDITTVSNPPREHSFLDPDEIKIFVKAAAKTKDAIPMLLYLLSCRASEVRALDWTDVDLQKGRIHIHGALVRDKHGNAVMRSENKTAESTRYIPIIIPELRAALEAVENKTGAVSRPASNTIRRHINALCEAHGLPQVGVHGLRHSFASLCYSLDIPVKVTMRLGGWTNLDTVLNIYTHVARRDAAAGTETLMAFFQNANAPENANGCANGFAETFGVKGFGANGQ